MIWFPPEAANADEGFALLDRAGPTGGVKNFDLDVTFVRLNRPLLEGFNALRLDLAGAFPIGNGNTALYVTLPLSIGYQDGATASGLGNIEAGATLVQHPQPGMWTIQRVGVVLPTASSRGDGAATNGVAAFARVSELILAMPSTFAARGSFSLVAVSGSWEARGDIGIDLPLAEASRLIDELSRSPLFRANLAIRYSPPGSGSAFALESVNTFNTEDALLTFGIPEDSSAVSQLGASVQLRSSSRQTTIGLFTDPGSLLASGDGFILALVVSWSWPGAAGLR